MVDFKKGDIVEVEAQSGKFTFKAEVVTCRDDSEEFWYVEMGGASRTMWDAGYAVSSWGLKKRVVAVVEVA